MNSSTSHGYKCLIRRPGRGKSIDFQTPAVLTFKKQLTDAFDRSAWVTENANCLHEVCKLNTKLSKRVLLYGDLANNLLLTET